MLDLFVDAYFDRFLEITFLWIYQKSVLLTEYWFVCNESNNPFQCFPISHQNVPIISIGTYCIHYWDHE